MGYTNYIPNFKILALTVPDRVPSVTHTSQTDKLTDCTDRLTWKVINNRSDAMEIEYISGASCSKLTTSLVNVSLKFQTLILQIHCYFLLKKCEKCKGFSHFFNKK